MVTQAQFDVAMRHGVIPALVGVINAAVVKFGHSFAPFANMGLLQGGLIGVVQGVVSNVFFDGLKTLYDKHPGFQKIIDGNKALEIPCIVASGFVGNVVSAAALFAISVVAVKAGIMASTFAVSGLVILTLANTALFVGGFFLDNAIIGVLQDRKFFSEQNSPNTKVESTN